MFEELEKILNNRVSYIEKVAFQDKKPFETILLTGTSIESVINFNKLIMNEDIYLILPAGIKRPKLPGEIEELLQQWTGYGTNWTRISIPDIVREIEYEKGHYLEGIQIPDSKSRSVIDVLKKIGKWKKASPRNRYSDVWDNPFLELAQMKENTILKNYEKYISQFSLSTIFRKRYRNSAVHELIPEHLIIDPTTFFDAEIPNLAVDDYATNWNIFVSNYNIDVVKSVSFPAKFLIQNLREVFKELLNIIKRLGNKGEINPGFFEFLDSALDYWGK